MTFTERLKNAYKALTGATHQRYPNSGNSWPVWSNNGQFPGTTLDYAELAGDLSQSSLIMSGVRWLGNVLPSAPLMLKKSDGPKGESDEIPDHKLVKLWRRPNQFYSGSTLLKGFAYSWILSGNAYFLKVWNRIGTEPVELWHEPHFSIRPRWKNDNRGEYIAGAGDKDTDFISYYELDRDGKKIRLEITDVIHFRDGFDPQNDRLGLSRVAAILREVYGDSEAANYAARMSGGSGVPPFVLNIDKDLDINDEDIVALENKLIRRTSGDFKGRPMVVTGATVEQMGVDPDKMDLRSSHRFSEERFSAVTGIPAVALELGAGHEHSIYNNVKQADERAYEAYLLPLYSHMENELDVQILEDFEGESSKVYCRFDLSRVRALQEDDDAKHTRVRGIFTDRIVDWAEARSLLNLEVRPEHEGVMYKEEAKAEEKPEEARLRLVKSTSPSPAEIEEGVEWWEKTAPPEARELIHATDGSNGHSEVIG